MRPRRAISTSRRPLITRGPKRTDPEVQRYTPLITLTSVLLPDPLGPISPVIRPGGISSETSSMATRPPKSHDHTFHPQRHGRTSCPVQVPRRVAARDDISGRGRLRPASRSGADKPRRREEQARDALRHQNERAREYQAIDDELVLRECLKSLGKNGERYCAEHLAGDRCRALRRSRSRAPRSTAAGRNSRGRDTRRDERTMPTGKARDRAADAIRQPFRSRGRDSDARRRNRVGLDRHHGSTELALRDVAQDQEQHQSVTTSSKRR